MRIDRLPQECIERLSRLLENGTSVDWKVLATEGFPSIYSDPKKLARIESSPRPASGLLHDLCFRGESVETLLRALKKIGNARAVSVILEEVPELGKNRVDREISPPPGIRSMQPEEVQITCFISSPIRRKGKSIFSKESKNDIPSSCKGRILRKIP
nr:uncharacterized protein LOC131784066 [Pocillopora verrucosa]